MSPVITNKQINNSYEKDEIALLFKNFYNRYFTFNIANRMPITEENQYTIET